MPFPDLWTLDLLQVGYDDVPTVDVGNGHHMYSGLSAPSATAAGKPAGSMASPCIGGDALRGVYFHPAVQADAFLDERELGEELPRSPKALGGSASVSQLNRLVAARAVQRLCPAVDVYGALEKADGEDSHDDLLLIVTFDKPEYASIPLFEVIYRHHFRNILYCGEIKHLIAI